MGETFVIDRRQAAVKAIPTRNRDIANRGSVDFFEVNEEKPQTTWEENGLIFNSKKVFNSPYIFDYLIQEIEREFQL